MGLLIILFLVLWISLVVTYYLSIESIAAYAVSNKLPIFGALYKNVYHLMADISFLNNLWAGELIEDEKDQELKNKLTRTKRLLKSNIYFSLILFFSFLVYIVVTT